MKFYIADEKKENHSQGRDYSIRYGKNSRADTHESLDEGKSWSDKQKKETGLTDRKPL